MKLITEEIKTKLASNKGDANVDKPYLKLFSPTGSATWLITEIVDEDTLFGLCDLGMGFPELGYVSLQELESVELPFGLKIERDMYFTPDKTLKEYASVAREHSRIVTEDSLLNDPLIKLIFKLNINGAQLIGGVEQDVRDLTINGIRVVSNGNMDTHAVEEIMEINETNVNTLENLQ